MAWSRRLVGSRVFQTAAGIMGAEYLRLVWKTGRWVTDPVNIYDLIARDTPVIIAMWHGQHYLMPFIRRAEHRVKVLISRHRTGEINAIAAIRLGIGPIRGSGNRGSEFIAKAGAGAFREMVTALEQGYLVAVTADVPVVRRVVGPGIIKLASVSGRPIYAVALATRRRVELKTWDRSVINLPFSRGAGVVGGPLWVPADTDAEGLENARRALQASLDAITARAYALADRQG
jgi:hypothetical protein